MHMNSIHDLSRAKKRAIFLAVDSMLVPLALYCAFAFRYGTGTPWTPIADSWVLFPVISMWGVGIIWALRLHRIKQALPGMIFVPAHDRRVTAQLPPFAAVPE